MTYLLDTHILLWSVFSPKKLSNKINDILMDIDNKILISKISLWEISLKYSLGKLDLEGIKPEQIEETIKKSGFEILDIESKDLLSYYHLEQTEHRDPFDRMLIWQSIKKNFTLISRDRKFQIYEKYGLSVIY